ncbi:MAG: AbrB/MazE/SpoVT family DNA-binding domain-containing protein [Rhodoferax sp.]|nr:AbrB/MazE/SpoVT family DNA-binding domain-containing protein [Rhodoferax sp.]
MTSIAISPKFQIVIPKAIRAVLNLRPGQRVEVKLDASGRVFLEPELDMRSARGFLEPIPGVDVTDVPNDPESPVGENGKIGK